MSYTIIEQKEDKKYIVLKFPKPFSLDMSNELPAFWTAFTEKLYTSNLEKLIEKHEAIGYQLYKNNIESYIYFAGCEVTEFEEQNTFEELIIPKGTYIHFKISFKNKAEAIEKIIEEDIPKMKDQYDFDMSFSYEFYPETFSHEDSQTKIDLVFRINQ